MTHLEHEVAAESESSQHVFGGPAAAVAAAITRAAELELESWW